MNGRVDRLRERLEEPLLVSDPANVRYLSGLESSNAALLVEPDRVRLFTDFRYAEGARGIEGVEFAEAKRDLYQTLSEELSGTIGFEATALTYERHARLHAGGLELVPRYGLVEELRAVKDEDELDAIRRAAAIVTIAFERFADEGNVVGQTERDLAWRFEQFLHEANAEGLSFPAHISSGPKAAKPHTHPGGRRVERGRAAPDRRGLHRRRLLLGLHAHVLDRNAPRRAAARVRRLPRRAAGRAGGRQAWRLRPRGRRRRA